MTVARLFFGATLLLAAAPFLVAAEPAKETTEPAEVSYYREVRPIFAQHCQGCHQPAKAGGGYVMISHADLLKKADSELAGIVPGKPHESMVIEQITPKKGKPPAMPRGQDPLADHEV